MPVTAVAISVDPDFSAPSGISDSPGNLRVQESFLGFTFPETSLRTGTLNSWFTPPLPRHCQPFPYGQFPTATPMLQLQSSRRTAAIHRHMYVRERPIPSRGPYTGTNTGKSLALEATSCVLPPSMADCYAIAHHFLIGVDGLSVEVNQSADDHSENQNDC